MAKTNDELLQEALMKKKRKEDAKKRVEVLKAEEEKAKQRAKEKAEERRKAAAREKKVKDESELLIKLAGIKQESKSSRIHFAGEGFFDLLNKFDEKEKKPVKDGDFSKKYNSVRIEEVAKVVLKCSVYYPEKDYICIFGSSLKRELDKLIAADEDLLNEAKAKLDKKWQELLLKEEEEAKKAALADSGQEEGKAADASEPEPAQEENNNPAPTEPAAAENPDSDKRE